MPSEQVLNSKNKPYRYSSGFFEQSIPISYFDLLRNLKEQGLDDQNPDSTINEIFNNTVVYNENLPEIISGHSIVLPDGTIVLPALRWVNDLTDGLYRVGSHDQAYVINGVVRTGWDSNGFRINVSSSTTFPALDINQASTGDAGLRVRLGSTRSFFLGMDNDDGDRLKLSINNDGDAVAGVNDIMEVTGDGQWLFTPKDNSDSLNPTWEFVAPFLTALTSGVEHIDFYIATGRNVQFNAGALSKQRNLYIEKPTYAFTGASTLTNAATVSIEGAPVAGTNATITNRYALWLEADDLRVGGNLLWDSGTAFPATQDHSNTAARSYRWQDRDGTVAFTDEVDAAKGSHLLVDVNYDVEPAFPGPRGDKGEPGRDGLTLILEADSEPGNDGIPGPQGVPGRDANAIFILEDGEPGEMGFPGRQGVDGAAGAAGADGVIGRDGAAVFLTAEEGEAGLDGVPGRDGAAGAAGSPGAPGSNGAIGPAVFLEADPGDEGPMGPPGARGADGAGGGGSATTVETNIATASWRGKFTITDAAITSAKKVLCWQAPGPYTGKGTRADEAEMQPVSVIAVEPLSGSAIVRWETPPMTVTVPVTPRAHNYGNGTAANTGLNRDGRFTSQRLGRVRGNVKFSYMVLT